MLVIAVTSKHKIQTSTTTFTHTANDAQAQSVGDAGAA
jgi:hypothetical protein